MKSPKNVVKTHPNAAAAGVTGGSAALLVTILAAIGIDVDATTAAWIVAAVPTVYLTLKRRGVKGLVLSFWKGDDDVEESTV